MIVKSATDASQGSISGDVIDSSGLSSVDSGMGSDGSHGDPPDPDTELCELGDQLCRFPLSLYELPDLTSILSVDTWNNVLSEEDRFTLAAYLPDMDQETFSRTLTELFSGRNFHFGNPVSTLFDRLKGGKLEQSVSLFRRGVNFFQRREHYFFLRRYQDSMVARLHNIRDAWENCPGYSVKQKLRMLKSMRGRDEGSNESLQEKRLAIVPKPSLPPKFDRENPKGNLKVAAPKAKARPPTPEWNRSDDYEHGAARKSSYRMRDDVGDDDFDYPAEQSEDRSWNASHKNALAEASLLKSGKKQELMIGDDRRKKSAYISEDYTGLSNPRLCRETDPGVTIASYGQSSRDTVKKAHYLENNIYPLKNQSRHRDMEEEVLKTGMAKFSSDSKARYNKSYLEQIGDSHFRYDPKSKTSKEKVQNTYGQKRGTGLEHSRLDNVFDRYDETESDSSEQVDTDRSLRKSGYNRDRDVHVDAMKDGLHQTSMLVDAKLLAKGRDNRGQVADTRIVEADLYEGSNMLKKRKAKAEPIYVDDLDEPAYLQSNLKTQTDHSTHPTKKGKWNADARTVSLANVTPEPIISEKEMIIAEREVLSKRPFTLITPTIHTGFSFSIIHLLSAVRKAMLASEMDDTVQLNKHFTKGHGTHQSHSSENMDADSSGRMNLPSLTVHEIVNRVRLDPGDPCILETQEPLHDLVRGVLKIFSSRTAPLGAKGWKALVLYEKSTKSWTWIGPVCSSLSDDDTVEEETSSEAWGIPHKMLVKLVDAFANWLKSGQEILKQIGSLPSPPLSLSQNLNENERFRDLKTQKCPITINPSSDEARAYFRREEVLRYSIPDRAFSYTAADGKKSTVAPLRRAGGKPTSKARDHFILKTDRPPHVTILCLVRDAAARLPGSIGTRADISTLIRDSQYVAEDVNDAKVNGIVSGALDRLHYEKDPCVQFDNDRKLWVYRHRDREEEDFDDEGTSSTKKWKKPRKHTMEHSDTGVMRDVNALGYGDTDLVDYSAEYDYNHDPRADSTSIHAGQKNGHTRSDPRRNTESIGSFTDSLSRHKSHGTPVLPQGFKSNFLRESKMLCKENSSIEDFDDEPFGRERRGR